MGGGEGFPFGCNPRLQFQVRFRRSVYKHHADHDARISSSTAAAEEEEEEEALGMEPMSRRSSVDSTPAIMSAPLPPKIPSFTLPARPDPPGMATPPIHLPGSVPFRWEDAPGKPKRPAAGGGGARLSTVLIQSRSLDLPVPPRLQGGSATSPADVLEGTYHLCSASEMRKSRSFREAGERAGWSWRRGRRGRREVDGCSPSTSGSVTSASTGVYSATSASASSSCSDGYKSIHDVGWRFDCRIGCWFKGEDGEKPRARVKISAAMRRSRSASDLLPSGRQAQPHHWLASIYGALKQVVLRRKECKEE